MDQRSLNFNTLSSNTHTPHLPLNLNSDLKDALDQNERTPFSPNLTKEEKLHLSLGPGSPDIQNNQTDFVTPNSKFQAQYEFQQQRLVVDNVWNIIDRDPKLALQKAREAARLISGNQVVRFLQKFYTKAGNQEGTKSNDPTQKNDTNKTRAIILWTQLFLKNSLSQQIFSEMMTKLEIALTNEINFNKKRLVQYIEAPHLTNNKYKFVQESQITEQTPAKDDTKKVTDSRRVKVGSLGITFPQPDQKKTQQFKSQLSDEKKQSTQASIRQSKGKVKKTVVDSQGWISSRGSELLEKDYSDQDEEEKKTKEMLLRGVIPVEHRDNFDIKRDEKAAFGVASEFQQILQGLQLFGYCVDDLENHIIPKQDRERDSEVQKIASFVKEIRIEMKNKGHQNDSDDRYSNILKELAEQQLLGEMIPVVKLIDILRRNGYYGRIETSSQTVMAIENVIKDGRKAKEKLHTIELQMENPDFLHKNANNQQKNGKMQQNKGSNDGKNLNISKPKLERSKTLIDLKNGIEVPKETIIQELQDLTNIIDQLENEKERSDHYYKGEIQLLTKQIQELQNQNGTNKVGEKNQSLSGPESIYTQAYRFYTKELEAHGESRALDTIHDQLLVRIYKEIEPSGDKASIEKLLNLFSNQTPTTLTDANLQIQKIKTQFLNLLASNDPILVKSLAAAEQQRVKPQSSSSENSGQYLSDQFVKLAKQTKFFKEKYMNEITASQFHPSQMKQILMEQPYIEYLVTSIRDFGQTNVNLQQLYDFLYEEGYEHIEKIQTWINRKYVKFREPHQIKEAIQVQQIRREATLMQKLTLQKAQLPQNSGLEEESDESDNLSQSKEESKNSRHSITLNKNSSHQVTNENPSNVKSLKLSAIPERTFEIQSVPQSNSFRDWDLTKADIQNLLELCGNMQLPLNEQDFLSAENLGKALNKVLKVEQLTHNLQNRSAVSLIFDEENHAKPLVYSKNIKCQYQHLENLIRDVQKIQQLQLQGGFLPKQEQQLVSSRNTIIYTARTSSTNEKQIQTKLKESELKLQNEFYELIQPHLQQILDQNPNKTSFIKQSLSSLFDYDVPKLFDEGGLKVTIPLFLQKLLTFIKSQLMLLNEPQSIDVFLKGINVEQSKQQAQHDQSSRTRSRYNLFGNITDSQALPQDCHALIMQFLQDQNDDYKQVLEKHLATLNINQLEDYLTRLLMQSYENDHLISQNTEYQRILQKQKLKYTTLQPETQPKENQPLIRPIVPKLNPHNRFSNSSFTTNFSAKRGMASTSRVNKTKTMINIQDMDRNSNNQTTLQKVLGLKSQPSYLDQNSAFLQTTYLKPLYNRARVQTAVPRTTQRQTNYNALTPISQCD